MSMDLLSRHCQPVPEGSTPLRGDALEHYRDALPDRWRIVDDHHLEGTFEFDDFLGALELTNEAGRIAESENHHPEITLTWGKASFRIWTHTVDGLTENDFILAARIEAASR